MPNVAGIGITEVVSLSLLQFCMAVFANALGFLVIWHRCRFVGAIRAEDLAAVPAVVLPVGDGESAVARVAVVHLRVICPLSAALPS